MVSHDIIQHYVKVGCSVVMVRPARTCTHLHAGKVFLHSMKP